MNAKALILSLVALSACVGTGINDSALCDATLADRKAHARALAASGDPLAIGTGRTLLEKLAAGCGR